MLYLIPYIGSELGALVHYSENITVPHSIFQVLQSNSVSKDELEFFPN